MRVICNLLCLYKWKFYKRAVIEFSFLRYDNEANKKVERERNMFGSDYEKHFENQTRLIGQAKQTPKR